MLGGTQSYLASDLVSDLAMPMCPLSAMRALGMIDGETAAGKQRMVQGRVSRAFAAQHRHRSSGAPVLCCRLICWLILDEGIFHDSGVRIHDVAKSLRDSIMPYSKFVPERWQPIAKTGECLRSPGLGIGTLKILSRKAAWVVETSRYRGVENRSATRGAQYVLELQEIRVELAASFGKRDGSGR